MNSAKKKLERITDFWNAFVWNYKVIQNQIVWDEEVQSNYYGDILEYYNNTFDLLIRKPVKKDTPDNIFYSIGLLQIIYIHQDLTDELLRIFKIQSSSKKDKNPNREIRNELIGHPISREKAEKSYKLKSSTFWGRDLTMENLHYIRYAVGNDFAGEEKYYSFESIISSHRKFLNKYFDKIISKIEKILKNHSKQLKELEYLLENEIDFNNIVELTSQRYEHIFEHNFLYNEKDLKECYMRKDEHVRYQYVVDYFTNELREFLIETQSNINESLSKVVLERKEFPQRKISLAKPLENSKKRTIKTYRYELGKLHEKKTLYEVSFFKDIFKDNIEIMEELENMEISKHNNLEYYSSFEYLKYLIKNRKQ